MLEHKVRVAFRAALLGRSAAGSCPLRSEREEQGSTQGRGLVGPALHPGWT